MQDATNKFSPLFRFTVCRTFLSTFILCNTSLFLTWSVQLIFSILLQHRTSKILELYPSTYAKCLQNNTFKFPTLDYEYVETLAANVKK